VNTIDRVKGIVADQLGLDADQVAAEARIKDDLGADSLDMVELIMELEEAFGMKIAEEDMRQILTIQDVVDYIEKNRG